MRVLIAAVVVAVLVALAAAVGTLGDGSEEAQASPWEFAQPMSQRRSYIAQAEIGGQIYAAGGMVGETGRPLDLLARYDPATDTWETLHRLPEPLRAAAAAAVDGTLYVIGGTTEDGNTAGRERLRPGDGHVGAAGAPSGASLQPRCGRARREDLRPRRLPRGPGAPGRLRLRPRRRLVVRGARAADSQPRLRRRRRRRGDLDDRRTPRRRDPSRRLDPEPRDRPLAARAGDARADGAPGRGGRRRRDPRRLGEHLPGLRHLDGRVVERPALPRDPSRPPDLLHRRRALHRRRLHDQARRQPDRRASRPPRRANFRRL